MPTLGFFAAGTFVHHIGEWANWLAFGVFLLLGATFIRNAWTETPECACRGCNRCVLPHWKNIFAIGIATSIDAQWNRDSFNAKNAKLIFLGDFFVALCEFFWQTGMMPH